MIPTTITRAHVEQALRELEHLPTPAAREATAWALVHGGRRYAPKYVLTIASRIATGVELSPNAFSGGEGTGSANAFLRGLGFDVQRLDEPHPSTNVTVDDVRSSFTAMYADPGVRAACLAFLADVVELCAAQGPARWLVSMRGPTLFRLSAGRAFVLSMHEEEVRVPVERAVLDDASRTALAALASPIEDEFRSLPGTTTYIVPADKVPSARALFGIAQRRFTERAAATARQTPYAYAHCPAVIDYLNAELGRHIAQPVYEVVETPPAEGARSWIFQANPKLFDLKGALGSLKEMNWAVRQQSKHIRAGDTAYLWLSGDDGGLLARARITADPEELPQRSDESPFRLSEELAKPATMVPLTIETVLANPVARDELLAFPQLADLGFLQAPQGTNFAVDTKQAEILRQLSDGIRPVQTVKIAPGEGAKYWPDCEKHGYICVGWDEVGDLRQYETFAEYRKAFAAAFPEGHSAGHITLKAKELWTLRSLRPGDRVVANRGLSEVVGAGQVVSGYAYRDDRAEYKHTVGVDWQPKLAGAIPSQPIWAMRTVDSVPSDLAEQIFSGTVSATARPESGRAARVTNSTGPARSAYESIRDALTQQRLNFSDELLSHYLLALQTKRFVLLTGISGTGKTQLALAVAKHFQPRIQVRSATPPREGGVSIRLAPYMLKYRRFVIPAVLRAELDADGPAPKIDVTAGGRTWTCSVFRDPKRSLAELGLRKDLTDWIAQNAKIGDELHLVPSEPAKGNVRLAIVLPERTTRTVDVDNYEVVAVRPDWSDGRSLLGFYNPIAERYETTAFLRLVLRASEDYAEATREGRAPYPFFAILDEMNLARVEHYFSDFLSVLESGEACVLHDHEAVEEGLEGESDERADTAAVPRRLAIPPNLFFTGTVNVDETTHMFSPKVLDRAFVIEMHDIDLEQHGSPATDNDSLRAKQFVSLSVPERPDTADWQELASFADGTIRQMVVDLHGLLAAENRHFGYRVANEIACFVGLAAVQAGKDAVTLRQALDLAVFSKVLPKLYGTTQELRTLIEALFAFAVTGKTDVAAELDRWRVSNGGLASTNNNEDAAVLPRCATKLWRMSRRLAARGFTSFIE